MLKLTIVPQKAIVVRRDKTIVAASWFGPHTRVPYIYPFLGPGNREVTRLGHPEDPVSHSHHRSIWMTHHDVGGVDFWSDAQKSGRIVQTEEEVKKASGDAVSVETECSWRDASGKRLLKEKRLLTFIDLPRGELALDIDTRLEPVAGKVILGKTNFGLLGIRVATTLRVHERLGGRIVNSNEAEDESGCFGQHAVWCDYNGPVPMRGSPGKLVQGGLPAALVGIACFDHADNSPHDTMWHVRDDGWMGPGISREEPRTVEKGKPLRARYRLIAHGGRAGQARIDERYRAWRRASR